MTKAEINKILKFGKFKDINHFYETHPNQDDEHTQQFMSEYNAYKNGGKIGMKTGGNIKPPKKEISLSGGLFGASKFANKKGGWDSLNDPNSYMTANGKVNYFAPLNKNSNAFFKGSVGTADFLTRLEPENYLQRDNNGNLTYNVAPEGYENENDFIASARLGMQTPQKKKFNRFTDRGEISAGLDYANGNIYPGAGFNYSADYNFRRRNSLPNTQYNKTAGSVGVYGDVNIAPVGIGKEQFENYAGTDSSSEFNQAMRTNLGVKAQYNFPKNGFFVRGNAEVNPLITNFKDGIKTLPSAQLTIGQRFKNGGMMKSRLPKYDNGGWDPFNPQPLEFSSGVPNYNIIPTSLTNDQVLANMAPSKPVTMDSINQSLGFFKTPGNAPVKTPVKTPGKFTMANAANIAGGAAGIAKGIVDSSSKDTDVAATGFSSGLGMFSQLAPLAAMAGPAAPIALAAAGVGSGIYGLIKANQQRDQNNLTDFNNMGDSMRRQRQVQNSNPYGMDSSYTMNAVNGGNIGPSNIKNYYADGGEMVPLNSNTEQVEGEEPQVVDGVVKRDDRTGQPIAMVDHNEVIKDGQQVFSDEKKISKKAGLTRTFAKTAEILAKQKGKLETQLEKRGGQDVYTANAIKAVDRQMNTLFGLQERTATQMGLREPAPQQAMAMRSGGNLRSYQNGGIPPGNPPIGFGYLQDAILTGGEEYTKYGLESGRFTDDLYDPLNKLPYGYWTGSNAKDIYDAEKERELEYEKMNRSENPSLVNNSWDPNSSLVPGWNTIQMQEQLKGNTNNNNYNTPYNSPVNPYAQGRNPLMPNTFVSSTTSAPIKVLSTKIDGVFNPTVPVNSIGNNIVAPGITPIVNNVTPPSSNTVMNGDYGDPDNPNSSWSFASDGIEYISPDGTKMIIKNNDPEYDRLKKYYTDFNNDKNRTGTGGSAFDKYWKEKKANNNSSLNPYAQPLPNQINPFVPRININPTINPITLKTPPAKPQEDRRAYDPDENLILSGLGNAAQMALLGRSEVVNPVFDPYENRTANYINNMPTNTNIRASLNELNKQRRLMQLQASQNSPTIAAAANSDIFSAAADSENKLRQDADNLNNQMRRERAVMQAQNSAAAGANRQAAMNKAIEETAMNKGITDTNRMAVMAKQTENMEKAWNYSNDKSLISNVLEFHDIKGGWFKTDALIQDNNAVNSFIEGYLNMTPQERKATKDELKRKSSKSKETTEFINNLPD